MKVRMLTISKEGTSVALTPHYLVTMNVTAHTSKALMCSAVPLADIGRNFDTSSQRVCHRTPLPDGENIVCEREL